MIRILYVADDARTLRERAIPFARHLTSQGWHVQGLAAGSDSCEQCRHAFVHARSIDWGGGPLGFLGMSRASNAVRELVKTQEFDFVHSLSTTSGFLARKALRTMRTLCYPRIIHSASRPVPSSRDRQAARWTDDLIVDDPEAMSIHLRLGIIPSQRLHLVDGLSDPRDCDRAIGLMEAIYARHLGVPRPSPRGGRRSRPHVPVEFVKPRIAALVAC